MPIELVYVWAYLNKVINGDSGMYQQVLGDSTVLPSTGDGNVALIAGSITLLVGAAIVVTTVLRIVAKRRAVKA